MVTAARTMSTIYRNHGYETFLNSNHDMIRLHQPVRVFVLIQMPPLPWNPFVSRLPSLSRIVYIVFFPSCQVSLVQRLGYEGPHFRSGGCIRAAFPLKGLHQGPHFRTVGCIRGPHFPSGGRKGAAFLHRGLHQGAAFLPRGPHQGLHFCSGGRTRGQHSLSLATVVIITAYRMSADKFSNTGWHEEMK